MNKIFILGLILSSLILNSCCRPRQDRIETYKPELIDRITLENSVQTKPVQAIAKSGKIYIKDNLMYLNDSNKGFHIYDYSNPESPLKIGFINILGATDLSIRGNNLYINQAVDLVTLNYNAVNNTLNILHRNKNVFPQKKAPNGQIANTTEDQIVINWTKV